MQHQETWPIAVLCEVLDVSRRGFYAYAQRQAAPGGDHEEVVLLARVRAIHTKTRQSDGSRRLAKPLQAEGFLVGRDNARRLMQAAGVVVRHRKRGPVTTDSRHGYAVAPNLWARQFDVEPSDTVWAGDITYLWTAEGWLYLAAVLDLHSRKVVGWAMSSRIEAALVREALCMALGRRGPAPGFMHHSDRGRQDACGAYQELLAAHRIRCSMSRKGDGLDNAVVERFFGSLKRERTALGHYATRQEARDDVIDDLEMFYNSTRWHSSLGYVSPHDFERVANVA
jgi:transposase InsO family protein